MLTGENGILNQATTAKEKTERAEIIERAQTDILGEQTKTTDGQITKQILKVVQDKYFNNVPEADSIELNTELISKKGNHKIKVSEIYNGTFETGEIPSDKPAIPTTESYVGYYADIDGKDGVDGIIYADLAKGNTKSGKWGGDSDGAYTIPIKTGLKEYEISETEYAGKFGKKDVIKLKSGTTGKERFYVMSLEDLGENTAYTWYNAAYNNMKDYATATSKYFEKGKTNTSTMISKWNNIEYGGKNTNPTYKDVWGQITTEVAKGWFVPSKAEWAAFAEELGITKDNHKNFGLSDWYWTSSQNSTNLVWRIDFSTGYLDVNDVNGFRCVRLSVIF